ncbi:MAG: hypothetical protein ACW96U_09855, partial [Candidatus Heimdallarchaeaceae archaeon]
MSQDFTSVNDLGFNNKRNNRIDSKQESEKGNFYGIKRVDTPGQFKPRGYFQHYQTVNLDGDGKVWEVQPYEEMKDIGSGFDYEQHRFQSDMPSTMPPQTEVMYTMWENSIDIKSAFFTPIFEHETTIDGKIWLNANI